MKKVIKYSLYTIISLLFIVVVVLCFIDTIVKYTIEKYDTQYLGREITIKNVDINLLNASVEINGFKLFEQDKKTVFVSFSKFYTQTDYELLLNNKIHFFPIAFDGLYANIINKNKRLNFSDIIARIDSLSQSGPKEKAKPEISKPLSILLRNANINHGSFVYTDGDRNIKYWLSDYQLLVPEYNSETQKISLLLASKFNDIAKLGLKLNYDIKDQFYDAIVNLKHFPVKHIDNYLNEMLRFKELTAFLDANLKAQGNIKNGSDFSVGGDIKLNDFNFIDAYNQKLIAFKQLDIDIDSLNIGSNLFKINSVTLNQPYFLFEMYDNGNSINRLLPENNGASPSHDSTVVATSQKVNSTATNGNIFLYVYQYFKQISSDVLLSSYSANKLQILNGHVVYNDFTLGEKMNIEASALNVHTSRISSSNDSVSAYLSSVLNQIGKLKVDYSADAKDFKDMTVNIDIETFPMTTFNPYSKYYTGFPFKKGGLTIKNTIKISDNILDSQTRLLLEKTKTGHKDKKIRQYKVPLKLLLALLRDRKGNVDIAMPVNGNLNDPNYKLGPVALKILKNLMVKTLTAPANLVGGAFSKKDLSEIEIETNYLDASLSNKMKNSLLNLKDLLAEKPDLLTEIDFVNDTLKEKELLIIHEMKKQYLIEAKHLDSLGITEKDYKQIMPTDSLFNQFINQKTQGRVTKEQSVYDKALYVLGADKIQKQYTELQNNRKKQLIDFIDTQLQDVKTRIKINNLLIDKNILNPLHVLSLDALEE